MNLYVVYRYDEGIVDIEFITNNPDIAVDKCRQLGGWPRKYHVYRCQNVEIEQ